MQLVFYLPTFNDPCMRHLLYLMFRCDVDVMENLEWGEFFWELNTAQQAILTASNLHLACLLPCGLWGAPSLAAAAAAATASTGPDQTLWS